MFELSNLNSLISLFSACHCLPAQHALKLDTKGRRDGRQSAIYVDTFNDSKMHFRQHECPALVVPCWMERVETVPDAILTLFADCGESG